MIGTRTVGFSLLFYEDFFLCSVILRAILHPRRRSVVGQDFIFWSFDVRSYLMIVDSCKIPSLHRCTVPVAPVAYNYIIYESNNCIDNHDCGMGPKEPYQQYRCDT